MKIYSAQLKGTTTVATGSNVSLTGSFTGSIYGFNDTLQYSSSVDSRIVVNTNRLNNIESTTASFSPRVSNLESKSASVDIGISNINSFTASNTNTSLNQLSGSLATTGSNTFFGTQTFSGSVYIANNLVVQGSSSIQYISASSVSIGTNIVQLNTANPSVRFAGLTMIDSGSIGGSGSFLYDSVHDEFIFVHRGNGTNVTSSHFVLGPETYDSLGNETYLSCNIISKGTGKEHLIDSCIFDNGTTTCIKNNLVGTGTMSGTTIYGSTAVCSPSITLSANDSSIGKSNNTGYLQLVAGVGAPSGTSNFILYGCANVGNAGNAELYADNIRFGAATSPYAIRACLGSSSNWFACATTFSSTIKVGGATGNFLIDSYTTSKIGIRSWTDIAGTTNNFFLQNNASYNYGIVGVVSASGTATGDVYALGYSPSAGTSMTPVLNWTSGGNVGINTTNFGERLNIGCGSAIAWQNTCNCQKWHIQYNSADGLNFVESAVADFRLFLKAGGNVGVGLSTPTAQLHICSAYSQTPLVVQGGGNGNIPIACFMSGPNQLALLDDNGNLIIGSTSFSTRGTTTSSGLLVCGRVGIGTASPSYLLHIPQGNNLFLSNLYITGTASNPILSSGATGGSMYLQGGGAGEGNIYLQGAGSGGNGYIEFRTNGSLRMTISSGGNIGAPSGTNIYNASDARLKQNVTTIVDGLDKIMGLNPVKFNWINNFVESEEGKDMLGFVAQEVQEVIPEAVENFSGNSITIGETIVENPLRVNEKFIIPVLVKAIQEQQYKIALLESCLGIN